jgi:hypothetical protein
MDFLILIMYYFFFFSAVLGFELRTYTLTTLPTLFWDGGLTNCVPGLAWNLNPSDLCLLRSMSHQLLAIMHYLDVTTGTSLCYFCLLLRLYFKIKIWKASLTEKALCSVNCLWQRDHLSPFSNMGWNKMYLCVGRRGNKKIHGKGNDYILIFLL